MPGTQSYKKGFLYGQRAFPLCNAPVPITLSPYISNWAMYSWHSSQSLSVYCWIRTSPLSCCVSVLVGSYILSSIVAFSAFSNLPIIYRRRWWEKSITLCLTVCVSTHEVRTELLTLSPRLWAVAQSCKFSSGGVELCDFVTRKDIKESIEWKIL